MSEPSCRWIAAASSGVKRLLRRRRRKVTPSSSARTIVSRSEKTWNPPESVRIGPSQPMKRCRPPSSAIVASPGRKWRWWCCRAGSSCPARAGARVEPFHGRLRADRHEGGRRHVAVRSAQDAGARLAVDRGHREAHGALPSRFRHDRAHIGADSLCTLESGWWDGVPRTTTHARPVTGAASRRRRSRSGTARRSPPGTGARLLDAGEGHHEREQRRARQVEVRHERVHPPELEARRHEQAGAALERRAARQRLERAPPSFRPRRPSRQRGSAPRPAPRPGSARCGSRGHRAAPALTGRNVSSPTCRVIRSTRDRRAAPA